MSTNRQVVTDALREIYVLDADETTASTEDADLALRELNRLMASMAGDGIDLGFPSQDNLSDQFPLDATAEAQIIPILARRLLKHFPAATISPSLLADAEDAKAQLMRAAVLANMEEADMRHIPLGEGYGNRASILTDE
jgi:hypothetical protein